MAFDIEEELKKLPAKPGVYLMHDEKDAIIYVGKAVSLKNRVRQYFQASRNRGVKIDQMVSHIARFEYIITDSELEALVLECNLIKEHRPKYNTMLMDDKTYPFIKVTVQEESLSPQFEITQVSSADNSPGTVTYDFTALPFALGKTTFTVTFELSQDGKPLDAWTLRDLFLAGGEPVLEGYDFNHTDKCRDVYLLAFVKQNLSNLTTWQDNSMDRRGYKKNDWNSKKEFKAKLPAWTF